MDIDRSQILETKDKAEMTVQILFNCFKESY